MLDELKRSHKTVIERWEKGEEQERGQDRHPIVGLTPEDNRRDEEQCQNNRRRPKSTTPGIETERKTQRGKRLRVFRAELKGGAVLPGAHGLHLAPGEGNAGEKDRQNQEGKRNPQRPRRCGAPRAAC